MKNGVLGVVIVVLSLMTTTCAGYLLNVNPTEELSVDYQYITDINGLFEHTGAPQFAPYAPPSNITGYDSNVYSISNPKGVRYDTTSTQNKYKVLTKGSEEVTYTAYTTHLTHLKKNANENIINVNPSDLNQNMGFDGWFGNSGFLHSQEVEQGITDFYHFIESYDYVTIDDIINWVKGQYFDTYSDNQIEKIVIQLDTPITAPNTKNRTLTPFFFEMVEDTVTLNSAKQSSVFWEGIQRQTYQVHNIFDTATNGPVTITYYWDNGATFYQGLDDEVPHSVKDKSKMRLMFNWNKQDATSIQTTTSRATRDFGQHFTMNSARLNISGWVNPEYAYVVATEGTTLNNAEGNYERLISEKTEYVETPNDGTLYPQTTLTGTIGGQNFSISGNAYKYVVDSTATRTELSISGPNIPEQGTQNPYVIAILDEGNNLMHVSYFREEKIWYTGVGTIYIFFNGTCTVGSSVDIITDQYAPYNIQIRAYNTTQSVGYPGSHWTNTYENSKIGMVVTADWVDGKIQSNPPYFLMFEYHFNKNYTQDTWDQGRYLIRAELTKDASNNTNLRVGYWTNGRNDNTHETVIIQNHYIGKWNAFYVLMNAIDKKLTIHSVTDFTNYLNFSYSSTPIYTVDLSSYTTFWDGAYPYIKGMVFDTNSKPLKWQISDTEVWLNDYGAVMVNPTLNVLDYFTDYEDYRVWIQSTAVYGSSIELNGVEYKVTKNSIDIDTGRVDKDNNPIIKTHQLNNYYITIEDNKMYLTFVDGKSVYDLGTVIDPTIKFNGQWFFKCALYNGVEILTPVLHWSWDMAFDALQFTVISILLGLIIFGYQYKTRNVKLFDVLVVVFSIALGVGYLIAMGDIGV